MNNRFSNKTVRVAYFAKEVSVSETFISDLFVALSHIYELEVYTSSNLNGFPGINHQRIDFYYAANRFTNKLLLTLGGKFNFLFSKRYAFYKLKGKLRKKAIDVAFIEYGTTAVLMLEYLIDQNLPFIVHFHGFDITSSLNNSFYRNELKRVFEKASYVIAASNHIKRLLVLQGCPAYKVNVIKLGIDSEMYTPLPWAQRFNTAPSLVFLGRLTPKKNPIALLHAFKLVLDKIPNVTLTLIGEGPLRKEIELTIESLGLKDKVILLGALQRKDAIPILNTHWVYVQHSVTSYQGDQEGFAISIAEAAALRLPVVSTLHNGIPENVIDGVTGFLVREYDYEEMGKKIIQLLEDVQLIKKFGEAGRQNVVNGLKPSTRIKNIVNLLNNFEK
ncbi:hypothetical protein GCM10027443_13880 [Pontibacter brevis]